jgi:hypothetical protein
MNFQAYKSKAFPKAINVVLRPNKSIILVAIQTDKEWTLSRMKFNFQVQVWW